MSVINFTELYPEGRDGSRKPLPKQLEFFQRALDPKGPKYVAYVSGIGGGKTINGCITMLAMGVMHPGDYLIGRLYSPELKSTTYKTFLEICPPELVVEHRIADMTVKIRSVKGYSTFFFRPLEEPDKFRSMNLSGFMIDECNQVPEAAFLLLQGRLRGPGLRKGILVSNPSGHDWIYRWFYTKSYQKTEWAKEQYYLIRGTSLDNHHLPEDYIPTLMGTWSEDRIQREIMGSFDAFEGMVFEEFDRSTHVIKPFKIPENWPRYVGIDHGLRNPAAWVWGAVGPDGEIYIYREFYKTEWLIEELVQGKKAFGGAYEPGALSLMRGEKIVQAVIDPSVNARKGSKGETTLSEYLEHLPKDFPLYMANNKVELGIDRVKQYLKKDQVTGKPLLYIFDTSENLIEEISQYRYQELRPSQEDKRSEYEKPVKVNDHAVDALRYLIMLMPEPAKEKLDRLQDIKFNSLEYRLIKDLQRFNQPQSPKDPFGSS